MPAITISDELRAKFPDIVELILGSESMNDEERQYWVNILPVMTPEQVDNLRDILESEKRQLADIDEKYAPQLQEGDATEQIEQTGQDLKKRREERSQKEMTAEQQEEEKTKALLDKIEQL